ncbi:MAG: hypothetical protein HKN31_05910 [Pricia sp.]|nr:hypothetical protein [Pricia sp.]
MDVTVDGDVVVAGSQITVRNSVRQDFIVAGGEVFVTKNAVILGNPINF